MSLCRNSSVTVNLNSVIHPKEFIKQRFLTKGNFASPPHPIQPGNTGKYPEIFPGAVTEREFCYWHPVE